MLPSLLFSHSSASDDKIGATLQEPRLSDWPNGCYVLTLQLLSKDSVNNILLNYDFDTTYSSKFKSTQLEQRYHDKKAVHQLANLIFFLAENKYISPEKKAILIKQTCNAKPCADDHITALFNGNPLTEMYVSDLFHIEPDVFYDSQELARTDASQKIHEEFLQDHFVRQIKTKCNTLYANMAYALLQRLLINIETVTYKFNKDNRDTLVDLVSLFRKALEFKNPETSGKKLPSRP